MTLGLAGWRTNDIGKFVKINGGLLEVSAYTSSTVVSGIIRISSNVRCCVTSQCLVA